MRNEIIEQAVINMITMANNDTHGYDQTNRWGPDYDCSSLVITCYESAGIPLKTNGATYTGNLYEACKKCGMKNMASQLSLINSTGLLRGDILLTPGKHTEVYIGNNQIVGAHINEKGKATGGKTGDQTGYEISVKSYYNYPWTYVMRYPRTVGPVEKAEVAHQVIRGLWGNGDRRKTLLTEAGYDYKEIQTLVNKFLSLK